MKILVAAFKISLITVLSLVLAFSVGATVGAENDNEVTRLTSENIQPEVLGSGECGAEGNNVIWTYYDDDSLVISGNGKMMDFPVEESVAYKEFCHKNKKRYKNLIIESGVTYIGKFAFEYSPAVKVHISDTVVKIAEHAFAFAENVKDIIISKNTVVEHDAFYECTSLKFVYFTSTKSDWENMNIAYSNTHLLNATVHYNTVLPIDHEPEYVKNVLSEGPCENYYEAVFTCSCGDSYTVKEYKTHKGGKANCVKKAICDVCGEEYGSLNPDNHSNSGYNKIKEPTCTSSGYYSSFCCSLCHEVIEIDEIVPAKGHTYRTTVTDATLTKNGKKIKQCVDCDYISSKTTIYKPATFTLSETKYTYNGKTKTPTVTVKDSKGKKLKKDTDYTVSYEKGRKAPGKYTVKITFKGNYNGVKRVYFTIAPKATSKISATQTTATITLKWSKVTGADGYRVYKYNTKTKKYEKLKDVTKTTLKISKLKAGTVYKYKVRAYTKDDGTIWGSYSDVFETATKTKTPTLKVSSTSKNKASFSWSNVSGESGYQVYYSTEKNKGFKKVKSYKANVKNGSKNKLKSGKKYYFKVRAYKKTDSGTVYSGWSSVKSVTIK